MTTSEANQVLVADDDPLSRRLLERNLAKWGFTSVHAEDGEQALSILERENAPSLAIIDWMMPKLGGLEVCAKVRSHARGHYVYLMVLTSRNGQSDVSEGLNAGADDYLKKPFDAIELQARLQVGQRLVQLERAYARKVADLESILADVRTLKSLLPICTYCKSVRDQQDYWRAIDAYVHHAIGTNFSHSICPACMARIESGELAFWH